MIREFWGSFVGPLARGHHHVGSYTDNRRKHGDPSYKDSHVKGHSESMIQSPEC